MDGQTERLRTDFDTKLIYPFFSTDKSGYNKEFFTCKRVQLDMTDIYEKLQHSS